MPTKPAKKPAKKRKTSNAKPGHRSLVECRKNGWRAQVVEKWVPMVNKRIDLFGFIDLVALDGKPGLLGIQATSTGNAPSRVTKILEECTEAAIDWLEAGNRIVVWGFALRRYRLAGGGYGKAKRWKLKEYVIVLVDGKLERRDPEPDSE